MSAAGPPANKRGREREREREGERERGCVCVCVGACVRGCVGVCCGYAATAYAATAYAATAYARLPRVFTSSTCVCVCVCVCVCARWQTGRSGKNSLQVLEVKTLEGLSVDDDDLFALCSGGALC